MAEQTGKEARRAVPPYLRSSTAAVGLPETSLDRRDSYKEGVLHFQRRFPSPGSIRSDSEEVSDEDNLSERIQSPCEYHTQLFSPQHRSARVGSDTSSTPLVMDNSPYLVGYPESDSMEESDDAVHALTASKRSLSPEAPPNDSSIVMMGVPATGVQPTLQNDLLGRSKAEASVEDKKRSFLYQSSSGEDEDSSNDGRHDESIRPSSPQVSSRPPRKPMPQPKPTESLQARPKSTKMDPIMAAYQPKPPGAINIVRVQQAIARKQLRESEKKSSNAPANNSTSSHPQYTTNDVITGRQNPIKGPRVGATASRPGTPTNGMNPRQNITGTSTSVARRTGPSGKAPQREGPAATKKLNTVAAEAARPSVTGINAAASPSGARKTASSSPATTRGTAGPSNAKKTAPSQVTTTRATASSSMVKKAAAPRASATSSPSNAKKAAPSKAPATQATASPSTAKRTIASRAPTTQATQATNGLSNAKKTAPSKAPATRTTTGPSNARKTAQTSAIAPKPPTAPPTSLVMHDMLEEINGSAIPGAAKPPTSNTPPKNTPTPTLRPPLPNPQPTSPYLSKVETPHHNSPSGISSPDTITQSNTPPTQSPSKIKNEPTTPPSLSTIPSSPFQSTKPRAHNPQVHIRRPSGPTDFDIFIPPAPGIKVPTRSAPTAETPPPRDATSGVEAPGSGGRNAMSTASDPNVPARAATTVEAVPARGATSRGGVLGSEKDVSIWDAAARETVDGVSGCSKDGNVGTVSSVDGFQRGGMGVAEVEGGEGKLVNREEMRGGGMGTEREGREMMGEGSGMVVVGENSRNGEKEGAVGGGNVRKVPRNVVRFPKKKVEQDKGDEPSSQALTLLVPTSQAHPTKITNQIARAVKVHPSPLLDPYFIYRIKQKTWSASSSEEYATATLLGSTSTVLETANREAEELFTQLNNQFASSFAVQHKKSTSSYNDDGCLEAKGTLSSIGWPAVDVHFKVWVERGTVPSDAVPYHPPPPHTPFLRKTLYILRLYKLTKVPPTPHADGALPADRPKELSSSESDEESSTADSGPGSTSVSDPDLEGTRKKRGAEDVAPSDSRPSKRSKVAATPAPPDTFLRTHQEIPCPEVYTTLADANAAACNLQISIMQTATPLRDDQRAEAVARLRRKVVELEGKQGGEGYWRSEFPVGFSGRSKFEMVVQRVGVCGPRNV